MRAIRIHSLGGPEVLQYEEVADPVPGEGQALIRIAAAGVNFVDVYFRTGLYKVPALPYVPGQEAAGTVAAVGPGVTEVAVGDRVAFTGIQGTYAELALAPAARLVELPAEVDFQHGAAAMLQGITAHYLASSTYPLKPGDVCIVHAAAGGVGQLLCQIAKLRGARVLATVSTEEKARIARDAGADEVILYSHQDFSVEAKRLNGGKGVQVIYDGVGQATFAKGLDTLAPARHDGPLRPGERRGAAVRSLAPQSEGVALPDPAVDASLHRRPRRADVADGGDLRLDRRGEAPPGHRSRAAA